MHGVDCLTKPSNDFISIADLHLLLVLCNIQILSLILMKSELIVMIFNINIMTNIYEE